MHPGPGSEDRGRVPLYQASPPRRDRQDAAAGFDLGSGLDGPARGRSCARDARQGLPIQTAPKTGSCQSLRAAPCPIRHVDAPAA